MVSQTHRHQMTIGKVSHQHVWEVLERRLREGDGWKGFNLRKLDRQNEVEETSRHRPTFDKGPPGHVRRMVTVKESWLGSRLLVDVSENVLDGVPGSERK